MIALGESPLVWYRLFPQRHPPVLNISSVIMLPSLCNIENSNTNSIKIELFLLPFGLFPHAFERVCKHLVYFWGLQKMECYKMVAFLIVTKQLHLFLYAFLYPLLIYMCRYNLPLQKPMVLEGISIACNSFV